LFLKSLDHREIGKVTAITEIGRGATYPDQAAFMPGGENQIGIIQHTPDSIEIIGGAANAGSRENRRYIGGLERKVMVVFNR
jgi:hypothetical protein